MEIGQITELLGEDWNRLQSVISDALRSDISLLQKTNESILANGGKMLRPMLCLLVARACSGAPAVKDTLNYAAASEMLHNATLLHDDVADQSSMRRGRPTVSALLGPSVAVLLGDYWLSRAMEIILDSSRRIEAVGIFAKTLRDLAEGEMLQLQKASTADTTEEDYLRVIYSKTASLFEAACVSGALSVSATDQLRSAAAEYARNLGLAFQIKDDILDYDGSEDLGKPLGSDLREQKITLPLLGALDGWSDGDSVRAMIQDIDAHPENCDQVRRLVIERGGVQYAMDRLEQYIDSAVASLSVFPASQAREALESIARYNSYRRK